MAARRRLLVALAGALLGGCGFRPLLKRTERSDVQEQLAGIEIESPDDRLGFLVRNSLLDQLNPTGSAVPTRYVLNLRLRRRTNALAIQLNNTITRYNLTVVADFELRSRDENRVVYRSKVERIASYNVSREPYADLVSEQAAERRAAEEVGHNIRTLLALHFAHEEGVA